MTNKVGAPLGSANRALKDGEEGATSFIHIKVKPSEKAAWVKASQEQGLSKWVKATLNKAVK
jgi:hypothetical protein